jgi:hypothetical protein
MQWKSEFGFLSTTLSKPICLSDRTLTIQFLRSKAPVDGFTLDFLILINVFWNTWKELRLRMSQF